MNETEMKQFVGRNVEAVLMNTRMVLRGALQGVDRGYAKFSSIDELFVLVHGRRLSIKLMLAGSFNDLADLMQDLLFPCSIFDKCKSIEKQG